MTWKCYCKMAEWNENKVLPWCKQACPTWNEFGIPGEQQDCKHAEEEENCLFCKPEMKRNEVKMLMC